MKTSDKGRRVTHPITSTEGMRKCAKPCHDCPFRKTDDPWLHEAKAYELVFNVQQGSAVICHHTTSKIDTVPHLCAANDYYQGRKPWLGRILWNNLFELISHGVFHGSRDERKAAWLRQQPEHIRQKHDQHPEERRDENQTLDQEHARGAQRRI